MAKCGLPEGVTIEFPRDGIEIQAYAGDIREKRRKFTVAEFEISEEAGELIGQYASTAASVYINVGGVRAHRMYMPERDAMEFQRTLNDINIAKLKLLDGRKVLQRGSVEKTFDDVVLTDVVEYVLDQRDDPESVIQGYEFVSTNPQASIGTGSVPFYEFEQQVAERLARAFEDSRIFEPVVEKVVTYDWDGVTPLQALHDIAADFNLDWWLDEDGILKLGVDPTTANVVGTVADNDGIVLSRYSVTEANNKTGSVHVRQERATGTGVFELQTLGLIAEANAEKIDGHTKYFDVSGVVQTPEAIEELAERMLVQEIMSDEYGSLEINGMASGRTETVAKLTIGDILAVDGSVQTACEKAVVTGLFLVNGVHHRIDSEQGWRVNVELSRVPRPGTITSTSVWYDPKTDKKYDTLEQYAQSETARTAGGN